MLYEVDENRKTLINDELQQKEIRVIDLNIVLSFAAQLKREKEESRFIDEDQDNEYSKQIIYAVDAFVALGGNSDTSGHVSKSTLIDILKSEFELSIDLENLLNLACA